MIGYTRKVGLRKPELQCLDCWMRLVECEHQDLALAEMRAHRARLQDDTLDEPVDPATCPHCCCTYTTECCYCDGSRTPLEDS